MANNERDEQWWADRARESAQEQLKPAVDMALSVASQKNPDQAAKDQSLGRMLSVSGAVVESDRAEALRLASLTKAQSLDLMQKSPVLSRFLSAQENADVAHDDLPPLQNIEQGVKDLADHTRSASNYRDAGIGEVAAGIGDALFRGYAGVGAQLGKAVGLAATAPFAVVDRVFGTQAFDTVARELVDPWEARAQLAKPSQDATLGEKIAGGLGTVAGMLPYAIMTGGTGLAAPGVSATGLPLSLSEYLTTAAAQGAKAMAVPAFSAGVNTAADVAERGHGVGDVLTAGAAAAINSLAQGAAPVSMVGAPATRVLSGGVIGGLTGEVGRQGMNLAMPSDMRSEFNAQDAVVNVLLGSALGGAMGSRHEAELVRDMRSVATETAKVVQDAQRAAAGEGTLDSLLETVAQSKLAQRAGAEDKFNQLVRDISDTHGADALWIDADKLTEALDAKGFGPEQLDAILPTAREQLEAGTGGQVKIPLADFLIGSAKDGGEFLTSIKPHLRVDPNGVTFNEAKGAMEAQAEKLKALAPDVEKRAADAKVWADERRTVFDDLHTQISATGKYGKDYNRSFAELGASMYSVLAERTGMTPAQARKTFNFDIASDGVGEAAARLAEKMNQFAWHGSPHRGIEQFSTDKIGTGEGNITYGWGLYFSNLRDVAEYYRKALSAEQGDGGVGQLYRVRIPEDNQMLLWDVQLSAQHESVLNAISADELATFAEYRNGVWSWLYPDSGEGLYRALSVMHGSDRAASERLLSLGVKGIKYLDGGSRHSDGSTHNYVIFDGADTEITGRLYQGEIAVHVDQDEDGVIYSMSAHDDTASVGAEKNADGSYSITESYVPEDERGMGLGVRLYERLLRAAFERGAPFVTSDMSVSADAQRMYAALERRGYVVERNPNAYADPKADGAMFAGGEPVYRVLPPKGGALRQSADDTRAEISFHPDRDPIMALFSSADESSPVHELSHFFLEAYSHAAVMDGADAGVRRDMEQFLKWVGFDGTLEDWRALPIDKRAEAGHEKFAQTFEAYLLTGKAPTPELSGVFQQFKSWLSRVYQSIRSQLPLASLDSDIVKVLDRMVASEEAIEDAQRYRGMVELVAEKPADWSDEKWAEHQAKVADANDTAKGELYRKSIGVLQWMGNARTEALKKLQKQHDTLRREVRMGARREVMQSREYQAWYWLSRPLLGEDKLPDMKVKASKDVDPAQDSLFHAIAKIGGINRDSAAEHLGVHPDTAKANRSPVVGKTLFPKKGGLSADEAASALAELGYLLPNREGRIDLSQLEEAIDTQARGQDVFSVAKDYSERRGSDARNIDVVTGGRLDIAEVRQLDLPKDVVDRLIERGFTSIGRTGKSHEGWPPEMVAQKFGFDDAVHMVHELAGVQDPQRAVEDLTDRRMIEDHAELANEAAIQRAADAAIYNEARLRMFAAELRTVDKGLGSERAIVKAAKQLADEILGDKQIRDLRPDAYAAAAARAGRLAKEAYSKIQSPETAAKTASSKAKAEAEKAGLSEAEVLVASMAAGEKARAGAEAKLKERGSEDPTALAIKAKREQILQGALARKAAEVRAEMQDAVKRLREVAKIADSGKLGAQASAALRGLLGKYNLADMSGRKADAVTGITAWVRHMIAANEPVTAMPMLQGLLSKVDAKRFLRRIESRDAEGNLLHATDAEQLAVLAEILDDAPEIPYVNLTVSEMRGLLGSAENMVASAATERAMRSIAEHATYASVRDAIVDTVNATGSAKSKAEREATGGWGRQVQDIKKFGMGGIRMSTLADLIDGGKWGGAFAESTVISAGRCSTKETAMRRDLSRKLADILDPVLKEVPRMELLGKRIRVPGLPGTVRLSWEERFAVVCNAGNEGNYSRLVEGGIGGTELKKLTPEQISAIGRTLSPKAIEAAQAVWDLFESLRPQIAELALRTEGREPDWTVARPIEFVAADGSTVKLRGGHFPIKYDQLADTKSRYSEENLLLGAKFDAAKMAATTQQTYTKQRADIVKEQPLALNLRGLYSGLDEVLHDLSWREWTKDQSKLLRSSSIKNALLEKYGPRVHKEWHAWATDLALGGSGADAALGTAFKYIRGGTAAAGLMFNATTALFQGLGVAQSAKVIGADWFAKGATHMQRAGVLNALREMKEKSPFMAQRPETVNRDLLAVRARVAGNSAVARWMSKWGYAPMLMVQQMVDAPTWWGAYHRAMAEGHVSAREDGSIDDSRAIDLADQAVKRAQGNGEAVDLSRWERDPHAAAQLFTMFYNFMGTQLNVLYGTAKEKSSAGRKAAWIAAIAIAVPVVQAIAKDLVTPGDADADLTDTEALVKYGLSPVVENGLGMIPGAREFTAAWRAFEGQPSKGYTGPTGLRLITETTALAKQLHQAAVGGEFDSAFRKSLTNVLGIMLHWPSAQINRMVDGWEALSEDKTDNPAALLLGHQEPK